MDDHGKNKGNHRKIQEQLAKTWYLANREIVYLLTLRSLSSLFGDLFREFRGGIFGGLGGYSGGFWRSFLDVF